MDCWSVGGARNAHSLVCTLSPFPSTLVVVSKPYNIIIIKWPFLPYVLIALLTLRLGTLAFWPKSALLMAEILTGSPAIAGATSAKLGRSFGREEEMALVMVDGRGGIGREESRGASPEDDGNLEGDDGED
jgi:hypothetical protein